MQDFNKIIDKVNDEVLELENERIRLLKENRKYCEELKALRAEILSLSSKKHIRKAKELKELNKELRKENDKLKKYIEDLGTIENSEKAILNQLFKDMTIKDFNTAALLYILRVNCYAHFIITEEVKEFLVEKGAKYE